MSFPKRHGRMGSFSEADLPMACQIYYIPTVLQPYCQPFAGPPSKRPRQDPHNMVPSLAETDPLDFPIS